MSQSLLAMPSQILLMRHAEKPDSGNELSEQGWQRARLLPNLFTSRQEFKNFGLPMALYAMSPKKDDGSIRSIQTLKYVSEQFSIPIEKQFNRGQIKELVAKIKNEKKFNGKMVVICWEH
ncbi:MAG: histidine phosphatase family protein, partial [Bdellovibrionaceae bacterium]|nr:histidine phosphatase family protein [Bdellovibrio sp.]